MDTAQWSQEIGEEMISNTCSRPTTTILGVGGGGGEKKARPQKEQAINCPRCNSTNTKFCYYNNYSLTQPRYFCKTCRRYWTEGGSLRNVPVGGGSRKNKRSSNSSTSSSSSSSSKKFLPADLTTTQPSCTTTTPSQTSFHLQNPKIIEGQDLNLAFPITQDYHHHHNISEFVELPNLENNKNNTKNNPFPISTSSSPSSHLSALEFLRNTTSGITSRGGLSGFMSMGNPDTNMVFSSGFALQDFKPTLNFGLDGVGNGGYGGIQGDTTCTNTTTGRISSFPFEDLRQGSNTSTTTEFEQNKGDTNGYWSGMLGGGSW